MIHKGTKELHTERLVLRRFVIEDAQDMFNNWANDPEVTKYLSWEPHGSIEVTENLLRIWEKDYENPKCYNWAIVFDGHLNGSIGLLNPRDDMGEAEAGYCISKAYWGRGIAAEALAAVLKYAFEEAGFRRIIAKHDVRNPNSGKVMRKCGMKYVETARTPLALKPEKIVLCHCYEILNPNITLESKPY
ncbi:MAG: GNAT family N-acetyltransferase [Clostridiales bacterium]|nr:GNAT family N-acetyltransferase [Clostridiales bacterium]